MFHNNRKKKFLKLPAAARKTLKSNSPAVQLNEDNIFEAIAQDKYARLFGQNQHVC